MMDSPMGASPDTLDRAKTVLDALREAGLPPNGIRFEARGPGEFEVGFSIVYGRDQPSIAPDEDPPSEGSVAYLEAWRDETKNPYIEEALTALIDTVEDQQDLDATAIGPKAPERS